MEITNTNQTPAMGIIWHTDSFWTSTETSLINAGMVKFNALGLSIPKNGIAVITRGGITRKYMLLDDIITVTRPALAKYGIYLEQHLAGDSVITRLVHESGQFIASKIHYVSMDAAGDQINNLMKMGGGLSYLRRYACTAILGLPGDDDTDAAGNDNIGYQNPNTIAPNKSAGTISTSKAKPSDDDDQRPWINLTDKSGKLTDKGLIAIESVETGKCTVADILKKYKVNKKDLERLHDAENKRASYYHNQTINQMEGDDNEPRPH